MGIDADPAAFQLVLELVGGGLVVVACDDHGGDIDFPVVQVVDQFHGVGIVGDSEIGAHFLAFDIAGVDAQDNFRLILELMEHAHFYVGVITWEDARGVVIEEEFAPEFEIEFVVAIDSLQDGGSLFTEVKIVIKADHTTHGRFPSLGW